MKKKSKMEYCCEKLKDEIEEGAAFTQNKLIVYDAPYRSYGIIDEESDSETLCKSYVPMTYCPFCGKKFPPDLVEKWSDVIWEELGPEYLIESEAEAQKSLCEFQEREYVPDLDLPEAKPLPEEFKTDEWWKKRGL
jgi:hypothetical protein